MCLPDEILWRVFRFLPPESFLSVSLTCRRFSRISHSLIFSNIHISQPQHLRHVLTLTNIAPVSLSITQPRFSHGHLNLILAPDDLTNLLSRMSSLRELTLCNLEPRSLLPVPWCKMGTELCPRLDSLFLRGFRVPSLFALDDPQAFSAAQNEISQIPSAFPNRGIKYLSLQDCEFKPNDWEQLSERHTEQLRELRLLECVNSLDQARAALSSFAAKCTKLTAFEFRQRHMPEYAKLVVMDCITNLALRNINLSRLNLSDCGRLPRAAWEALSHCTQLKTLICAVQVKIEEDDLLAMESALSHLKKLEELAFDANNCEKIDRKFVGRILENGWEHLHIVTIGHVSDCAFGNLVQSGWWQGAEVKYGRFEWRKPKRY